MLCIELGWAKPWRNGNHPGDRPTPRRDHSVSTAVTRSVQALHGPDAACPASTIASDRRTPLKLIVAGHSVAARGAAVEALRLDEMKGRCQLVADPPYEVNEPK